MSIIIYGPQGSGKTRNAEALRKHFKMNRVEDCGLSCDVVNPYPTSHAAISAFDFGGVLYLTNREPPKYLIPARENVIHIDDALRMAGIKP